MSIPNQPLRYFHAGALFSLKELVGNALLGRSISRLSDGRYEPILPQDLEINHERSSTIRDADLLALAQADFAIFNFDGTELDSGTVVEFIFAKFADIPAVLVRSDFRRGGDNHQDPWNLMVSDYPRTLQVVVNGMELYQAQRAALEPSEAAQSGLDVVAKKIITAFDELRQMPSHLSPTLRQPVYEWLGRFASISSPGAAQLLLKALDEKIRKQLL